VKEDAIMLRQLCNWK